MRAENAERCAPPLPESEVAALVRSAATQSAKPPPPPTSGSPLLLLADAATYWHTPDEEAWATVTVNGHAEHYPVRGRAFRGWLSREVYRATRAGITDHAWGDGCVWVDLGRPDWAAVRVTADGWEVVPDPPVKFRRPPGMPPLPVPEPGGDLAELWRFVNVLPEHRPLGLGFLVQCFNSAGPHPLLRPIAGHGAGKSTLGDVISGLVDPTAAARRGAPRTDQDLMITATRCRLLVQDNLSYLSGHLSDALCWLLTGGAHVSRTLYTNDEQTVLTACVPVIANGIDELVASPDLLDRSLTVELPPIPDDKRRPEAVLKAEYEAARPLLLGAVLDAVACALRRLPEVQARPAVSWPRMADFAQWATAAEPALGLADGVLMRAYEQNRAEANAYTLETAPVAVAVAVALKELLGRANCGNWANSGVTPGRFDGTASRLLVPLGVGQDPRQKGWPGNARALASALARLAPNLRAAGWSVEQYRKDNQKRWRIAAQGVLPVTPDKTPEPSTSPQSSKSSGGPAPTASKPGPKPKPKAG